MNCDVGHRCGLDTVLLWLWWRPAAAAPIRPLAWELPYASGAALKRQKEKEDEMSTDSGLPNSRSRAGWSLLCLAMLCSRLCRFSKAAQIRWCLDCAFGWTLRSCSLTVFESKHEPPVSWERNTNRRKHRQKKIGWALFYFPSSTPRRE